MNLVTPKAGAKHKLSLNERVLRASVYTTAYKPLTIVFCRGALCKK